VPDYCALEVEEDEEEEDEGHVILHAWFGPGGTVSPTHIDPYHNLLAQVVGSKAVRLFAPSQSPYLYAHEGLMNNNSQVDPKRPDLARFPLFAQARSQRCVLERGEMLYIPPLWWHFIESLEVSFSVSFWWGRRRG
jgi:lysine-specific demethylase 8